MISNTTQKKFHYIIWFHENDDESYAIIPAEDLASAQKVAQKMFGSDVISVKRYEP